jgi:nucleotide-binding universal stress UspA family protein
MTHTYLIVAGVDGSTAGQRALDWAAAKAAKHGATASVHAVIGWQFDPADQPEGVAIRLPDPGHAAHRALTRAITAAHIRYPDVAITGEVVHGDPAHVLVKASADADLLVLGSHGHTPLFHAVIGSATEMCIRLARCPVLVIPMTTPPSTRSDGRIPAAAA